MPQQDFAALSPQICLDLLPFLHLQVWPAACHPLCQLSRGGHLLSQLPHSLMKSAFCPAKDQTEAPCQALQGSGHIRSETQAPCEVLHEMLLPASPRNLYVLLGCSQGPYIRISLQLSHMLLNISVSVPPLPGVFSLLYTWPACPVPAEYQFGTLGHITRSSA